MAHIRVYHSVAKEGHQVCGCQIHACTKNNPHIIYTHQAYPQGLSILKSHICLPAGKIQQACWAFSSQILSAQRDFISVYVCIIHC